MHENFERYRDELDRIRLTEESKAALAESLTRHQTEIRRGMGKQPLKARHIAAVAAAVCLLSVMSVAAVAGFTGEPSLRGVLGGDPAGYDQSSGLIGRSVECGGWTVSITDCVGDENYCYLGVEVEAPEGTVLDGDYYLMNADFDSNMRYKGNGGGSDLLLRPLPDDDPTDNKVRMVYEWSEMGAGLSGARVRLKLTNFYEQFDYNWEEHDWNKEYLSYGEWDFGWMTANYTNTVKHIPLEEDIPIEGGDGLMLVDEIVVSPLGISFSFANQSWLVDWVEDWFQPMLEESLAILDIDGNPIPLYYSRAGQDINAGKAYRGEGMYAGWTCYYRFGEAPDYTDSHRKESFTVVDIDRIASMSVGGVTIPVR
ncbi:MAG: hypothetical protein HDT14_01025 [Oscillibacter sp.]|nr:hypothetical protein [Oscillibacter sp.]